MCGVSSGQAGEPSKRHLQWTSAFSLDPGKGVLSRLTPRVKLAAGGSWLGPSVGHVSFPATWQLGPKSKCPWKTRQSHVTFYDLDIQSPASLLPSHEATGTRGSGRTVRVRLWECRAGRGDRPSQPSWRRRAGAQGSLSCQPLTEHEGHSPSDCHPLPVTAPDTSLPVAPQPHPHPRSARASTSGPQHWTGFPSRHPGPAGLPVPTATACKAPGLPLGSRAASSRWPVHPLLSLSFLP